VVVSRDEILLRRVPAKWTDQRHDIEAPPPGGTGDDLGTIAPFWVCYDVTKLAATHPVFRATVENNSARADAKVMFEVVGDGKRLWAGGVLKQGEKAEAQASIAGVKELKLVCHWVDGWFSGTRGAFLRPRLAREPEKP
jgi:hypothetical protein